MQETRVSSLVGKIPWRMATHPVFLSDEFHGQMSLAGYSQQGHKELDNIEATASIHKQGDHGKVRKPVE